MRRARAAARGSWVTMMMVLPWSRFKISSNSRISSPDLRSRSPVGSSGDADALLLAAGELARIVLRAVGEADDLERHGDAFFAFGAAQG